jgi:hypothetical protein
MDQKQLTHKNKAEHPQTKTKTKNKQKQQKQNTKQTAKRKPNNPHGIHLTKGCSFISHSGQNETNKTFNAFLS